MFGTGELALEQAPPLDLPARFFLTAPLFAAAAGLLIAWEGEALLVSRWTPGALAAVHLLAVGFLGQIMCGAVFQMLPVVAGAPVPRVRLVGTWSHLLLSLGCAALALGLWVGGASALSLGGTLVALGFLVFLGPVLVALSGAAGARHTVRAMRIAAGSLAVTVALGLLLTGNLIGSIRLPSFTHWVDAHAVMGLMGWVGLLIVGVAFQIIPMFYVTPPYAEPLGHWLAPAIITTVGVGALLRVLGHGAATFLFGAAAVGYVLFAVATMRLLSHPRRKGTDATQLHWWIAMSAICAAAGTWALSAPVPLVGVLLLLGVGVGLTTGMLLKILPFLSWFHLQHLQLASGRLEVRVPYMHTFISKRFARAHLVLHSSALVILVAATGLPAMARIGGVLLGLSALFLEALLVTSALRYRRVAWSLKTPIAPSPAEIR